MNLASLFSLGVLTRPRDGNPFHATQLGRLPFLVCAKRAAAGPIHPALEEERFGERGWGSRIETATLKLLVGLLVGTVLVCGFGMQHIAYTRQRNELGRRLREREQELRAVTQSFRALEAAAAGGAVAEPRKGEGLPVAARTTKPPGRRRA